MIGTREWLARTGGALSRRERLAHQAGAIAVLTADMSSRMRFRWAAGAEGLAVDATPPATDLVRAATAWAESVHEPWLLRHGLRTWLFGRLLGQLDGTEADAEALYLACLLHDVGVTDEYRIPAGDSGTACSCFAAHGAHVSQKHKVEPAAQRT